MKGLDEYIALLQRLESDLSGLAYELSSRTIDDLSGEIDDTLKFDAVPLLRKIKDARKIASDSAHYYSRKKRRVR